METTLKEGGDRSARTHPPLKKKIEAENCLDRGPKSPPWRTTVLNLEFKPWPLVILVGVPSSHPWHFVVVFFLKYRFRLLLGRDGFFCFFGLYLGDSGAGLWEWSSYLFYSNSRDCRTLHSVWITVDGVLPDISSSLWIEFDEVRHQWVQRHRDTETQRHRDTETQRHRETVFIT